MRTLLAVGVLAALVLPEVADSQQADAGTARVHLVRPGDTLWDLAREYLDDPYRWPDIFSINQGVVADPHWIYPQSQLRIPSGDGPQPLASGAPSPAPVRAPAGDPRFENRTVFYTGPRASTPQAAELRLAAESQAPVVPAGRYLAAGLLVPDSAISPIGRLTEVVSPTVVDRSAPPQVQLYDRVRVALTSDIATGERVQILRRGRAVEPYGRIYHPTGSGLVMARETGVATIELDRFYDRVALDDLIVPMPEFEVRYGESPMPASGLVGHVLALADPQPVVSTEDIVFINLGATSGVVEGDEYLAYLPVAESEWGPRPETEVARLQVVRVSELTSAVRVIALEQPALQEGTPVRVIARMR